MKEKGFTVIELVIVSAIFVVLFAVSVANYRQAEKTESLRITGHQLTADISWLQTAAISGTSSDHGMGFAYGIKMVNGENSYLLFRDDNNDKDFDKSHDRILKRVNLSGDFFISELRNGAEPASEVVTVFLPPRPVVYTNGVISQAVYVKISRSAGGDRSVEVTIDPVTGRAKQNFIAN